MAASEDVVRVRSRAPALRINNLLNGPTQERTDVEDLASQDSQQETPLLGLANPDHALHTIIRDRGALHARNAARTLVRMSREEEEQWAAQALLELSAEAEALLRSLRREPDYSGPVPKTPSDCDSGVEDEEVAKKRDEDLAATARWHMSKVDSMTAATNQPPGPTTPQSHAGSQPSQSPQSRRSSFPQAPLHGSGTPAATSFLRTPVSIPNPLGPSSSFSSERPAKRARQESPLSPPSPTPTPARAPREPPRTATAASRRKVGGISSTAVQVSGTMGPPPVPRRTARGREIRPPPRLW